MRVQIKKPAKPVSRPMTRNDRRPASRVSEPIHYPTLINKPGEFVMLPKFDLLVDPTYQRPVNWRAVSRISLNWNWIACGILIVSIRSDGNYYLVDGQHRCEAARLVDSVTELPCLAFEINDVVEEARGFLAANTERNIPATLDRFNALVTIKDPVALSIKALADQAGLTIKNNPGHQYLRCVGELMRRIRADEKTMIKTWPLIIDISKGKPLSGRLVKGIFYLERRMPKGYSLTDKRLWDRLVSIGSEALLDSMRSVAAIEGNANERSCAQGILRALNKGSRNRIYIDMD